MDLDFRSPLHSCAWQGNDRVMEMLLFYGANCDHACKQGATALGISAQEGHENCVSILLQYGASPNKSDLCGRTPIKLAMKSNNYAILRLLENSLKSMHFISIQNQLGSINTILFLNKLTDEGLKVKQRNAAHKILQSPPEKKASNVSKKTAIEIEKLIIVNVDILNREPFSMRTPCDQMLLRIMLSLIERA